MEGGVAEGTGDEHDRQLLLEKARLSLPLTALYLIADYNRRAVLTKRSEISAEAFFQGRLPSGQLELIQKKVKRLFAEEGYFGEKHWTGVGHRLILQEMSIRHPGFSIECYELTLDRGIISMR